MVSGDDHNENKWSEMKVTAGTFQIATFLHIGNEFKILQKYIFQWDGFYKSNFIVSFYLQTFIVLLVIT